MAKPRLTPVQRDVLDRLRDGWELWHNWPGVYTLTKHCLPTRHVATSTAMSLIGRGLVKVSSMPSKWTIA